MKKLKNKMAFSFIEVIISVFILGVGLVAVLGPMADSLKKTMDARDQEIAGFLAQEGVELVRNIRDNTWAKGYKSWEEDCYSAGCSGMPLNNKELSIFTTTGSFINLFIPAIYDRVYITENGFYQTFNNTGDLEKTKFKRRIFIEYCNDSMVCTGIESKDAPYAKITSVVIWKGSFTSFSGNVDTTDCNVMNKCSFTQTTLSRWGE